MEIKMPVFLLHKGKRVRIDINHSRFSAGGPDIRDMYITSDDPPRFIDEVDKNYNCIVVGFKMSDYITVSLDALILDDHDPIGIVTGKLPAGS